MTVISYSNQVIQPYKFNFLWHHFGNGNRQTNKRTSKRTIFLVIWKSNQHFSFSFSFLISSITWLWHALLALIVQIILICYYPPLPTNLITGGSTLYLYYSFQLDNSFTKSRKLDKIVICKSWVLISIQYPFLITCIGNYSLMKILFHTRNQ